MKKPTKTEINLLRQALKDVPSLKVKGCLKSERKEVEELPLFKKESQLKMF